VAGLREDSLRLKEYEKGELAHYALATTDILFKYPFGWEELLGIANRGDYDLKSHSSAASMKLHYTDPDSGKVGCGVVCTGASLYRKLFLSELTTPSTLFHPKTQTRRPFSLM